jgi:hypothetical protein
MPLASIVSSIIAKVRSIFKKQPKEQAHRPADQQDQKLDFKTQQETSSKMSDQNGGPDPNMFTTPFQLTKSLHRHVYPAVEPASPSLRVDGKGKVVLVTGAAGGLGYVCPRSSSLILRAHH